MRSIFLSMLFLVIGIGLNAQKLSKAKDQLEKKKYAEARTEIDSYLAKNADEAEAWYVKSKIYGTIAADSTIQSTVPGARDTAFAAIKKYLDLESTVKDSAKRYVALTMDNRAPLTNLYAGYSKDAASFYNAGNYTNALTGFKKSLDVFDLLVQKNWTNGIKLDTISVLYAGISAEKASKMDTAAMYYSKIAESKSKGQGYESIYKWLADYYKQKNDQENAAKYLKLGKEVYPDDPFWLGFEVTMLSEKGNKDELFTKYEEVTKANPTNPLYFFNYAVELYKTAYNEDTTKRPPNAEELTTRAIEKAEKSIELDPKYPNSRMLLGQIFYNQGVDIVAKNKLIRPSGGVKLKPDQLKKKEAMRTESAGKFDSAIVQFKKLDELLGGQGKLKMEEKQFLKDSYDLLITVYEQRNDQANATKYTEKFNNVDKVH
jgi:tetratricopeptide (TPR) repeat protein